MTTHLKDKFIVVRVPEELKLRILKMAKKASLTLSDYLREVLEKLK